MDDRTWSQSMARSRTAKRDAYNARQEAACEPESIAYAEACALLQNLMLVDEGIPVGPPATGRCWGCKEQIYGEMEGQIVMARAGREHITDCPFCRKSFCE